MNFLKPTPTILKIFITLIVFSAVLILIGIILGTLDIPINEFIGLFVYRAMMLPLVLFDWLGLPTTTSVGVWFAVPSRLGLILDVIFYLILFYLSGCTVSWIQKTDDNLEKAVKFLVIMIILVLLSIFFEN